MGTSLGRCRSPGFRRTGRQVQPGRQTRPWREHAARYGGADAFGDLLGERRARRSIEFQRLAHAPMVHEFCQFLVLFKNFVGAPVPLPVPRTRQRHHDPAHVRLDLGHHLPAAGDHGD